ncbi:Metallo-beta-lactamase superfamily protein [Thalassococcus halodurans]|uniref:Metallo-beta-lactamase superfamily protein n=1 Tax=Thalassococcus halodurans TaxID=373675 RepID=A0A1H5T929_9RHOB|nr:MBL fold metallo-hydrolase [Thalassococcus halodurans]SEF59309.1 Metallo-beta-lactamase superfamily protein [Thalassococcus halodurans]
MRYLTTVSAMACVAVLTIPSPLTAAGDHAHNPANTISTDVGHPDSFRHFAPELPAMQARIPEANTEFGLHVSEIEPGLFFITDFIYQSAFLVTDEGVVVFDAPPSFGDRHRAVIEMSAPGVPITHFILSHKHADHNGGGYAFGDIEGLTVIAAQASADSLAANPLRGVLKPNQTFDESLSLTVGGVPIELQTANFHANDTDVIIHLPQQKFLMAIDTITPGEAPFMNFGATSNLEGYMAGFDTFLSYDFEHFLSGHVSVLGKRQDVETARDYAFDVRDTVYSLWPSFLERFGANIDLTGYQNGNLAYRMTMEDVRDECAAQIIDRWEDKLSVVDLWADSHCETVVLHAIMH